MSLLMLHWDKRPLLEHTKTLAKTSCMNQRCWPTAWLFLCECNLQEVIRSTRRGKPFLSSPLTAPIQCPGVPDTWETRRTSRRHVRHPGLVCAFARDGQEGNRYKAMC